MSLLNKINRLSKLNNDIRLIEKSLVYLYLQKEDIIVKESHFFKKYFQEISLDIVMEIKSFLAKENVFLDLDTLVEIFELLLTAEEKKENGMVYTPKEIKEYIITSLITSNKPPTVCDPACGCGSFLISVAKFIHDQYKLSYKLIFNKYLFGVDIVSHNIEKSKVLLNLLALTDGEVDDFDFNLHEGNSLSIDWEETFFNKINNKFDIVIGNPPYVRAKNIKEEVKESLKKWNTAQVGNSDLYIPFYELGLQIINDTGKLGFISVNTFLKSLNGRLLRSLFIESNFETKIIDFKEVQMFKQVTSYTCITLINKSLDNGKIWYSSYDGEKSLSHVIFYENKYSDFDKTGKSAWNLGDKDDLQIIRVLENSGKKLGEYLIKNGLATLKNDIFFFTPKSEDDKYYYREYQDNVYKIEKAICIEIAKPNIMKNEADLVKFREKGIFPYRRNDKNKYDVISEREMQITYPETYYFLSQVREILDNRDKGKRKYPAWYAYGRTQGMNNFGKKLLMPYITDKPVAILSLNEDILFYCGYALFSEDEEELKFLKKILESTLFWFYLRKTSKPYSKGYFSTAKNYLIHFTIPNFSQDEKEKIISMYSKEEIDRLLCLKYDIQYDLIVSDE